MWILTTSIWYFYLFLLGLAFLPLTTKIFSGFWDKGYAFSKTIAIIGLSYAIFLFGILKLVPFTAPSLYILLLIAFIFNYYPVFRYRKDFINLVKTQWWLLLIEELLFISGLFFLAYVRGQEPSIHGLEKFMDFGFMDSILRSKYFPPLDMWYSAGPGLAVTHSIGAAPTFIEGPDNPHGFPINYYYFGHLTGAFLIKLTDISPFKGYNLILATILAQGLSLTFSLCVNIIRYVKEKVKLINLPSWKIISFGILGSYILNFGGNLHTIYLFTSGYPNDTPIPFWKILSGYNPTKYWYPNATRFIPFTIHEFPSYSYVVADLHGHVFDIPFVLLTLAILFRLFITIKKPTETSRRFTLNLKGVKHFILTNIYLISAAALGFMAAIHYMTNAFDGPIYILLSAIIFYVLLGLSPEFFISMIVLVASFVIFSLPFSIHFSPFVSGIGVNCSPAFLVAKQKIGPFLFEKGNCQSSPLWMLFILWGFFWVNFLIFAILKLLEERKTKLKKNVKDMSESLRSLNVDIFIFILFSFGTFLLIIPEFFYIKDIYPAHFRANTMFKLGYQAFMMMSIASTYVFFRLKLLQTKIRFILQGIFIFLFLFIFIYPFFAFPSYYGDLKKEPELNGSLWLEAYYPGELKLINYMNNHIKGSPVILEAQGDSYTDYDVISSYTGLPTVAGWWVHEWLWRGTADIVGKRIPDISNIYQSNDINLTKQLLKKYHVSYVVITALERQKYPNLNEKKFDQIGKKIYQTNEGNGALYQVKP